jgi:hypothetical protein
MNPDLQIIVNQMNNMFDQVKEAGLYIVGGIIGLAIIFIVAYWAWMRIHIWLTYLVARDSLKEADREYGMRD